MKTSHTLICLTALVFLLFAGDARAAGVLLTKKYPGQTEEFWTPVEFTNIQPFAASVTVTAKATGQKVVIQNAQVGIAIHFPDLATTSLVTDQEIASLKTTKDSLVKQAGLYKAASGVLNGVARDIDVALQSCSSGNVLVSGRWMSKSAYDAQVASASEALNAGSIPELVVGGQSYKNVRVRSVSGDRIGIMHDGGVGSLDSANITPSELARLKVAFPIPFANDKGDGRVVGASTAPQSPKPGESDSDPQIIKAKSDLAAVEAKIAGERARWQQALDVINKLTNFKRTPVREGSQAYRQCLEASKTIESVEKGASKLKDQKVRLEQLVAKLAMSGASSIKPSSETSSLQSHPPSTDESAVVDRNGKPTPPPATPKRPSQTIMIQATIKVVNMSMQTFEECYAVLAPAYESEGLSGPMVTDNIMHSIIDARVTHQLGLDTGDSAPSDFTKNFLANGLNRLSLMKSSGMKEIKAVAALASNMTDEQMASVQIKGMGSMAQVMQTYKKALDEGDTDTLSSIATAVNMSGNEFFSAGDVTGAARKWGADDDAAAGKIYDFSKVGYLQGGKFRKFVAKGIAGNIDKNIMAKIGQQGFDKIMDEVSSPAEAQDRAKVSAIMKEKFGGMGLSKQEQDDFSTQFAHNAGKRLDLYDQYGYENETRSSAAFSRTINPAIK